MPPAPTTTGLTNYLSQERKGHHEPIEGIDVQINISETAELTTGHEEGKLKGELSFGHQELPLPHANKIALPLPHLQFV